MKTLLLLSALFALSFAASTTQWATCDAAPADTLIQPINVTLIRDEKEPKITITLCGKAKENIHIHGNSIQVFIAGHQYVFEEHRLYYGWGSKLINAGQEFCHDSLSIGYYDYPADYVFKVNLRDDNDQDLNCFNVNMTVQKSTQLSF